MIHPEIVLAAMIEAITYLDASPANNHEVSGNSVIDDLQMDNLDWVETAIDMEDYHGMDVDVPDDLIDEGLEHATTLRDLAEYLAPRLT